MSILFAATGEIAIPLLESLSEKGMIRAVMTAPDAPGKRGKSLIPSPVKKRALELGLEVYTPEHLRGEEREYVSSLGVDTLLSFCYGKIFGPKFLALFEYTYNVHPSLLPLYRGCSPIYQAIRDGVRTTGISIQKIALGIDEGDIYSSRVIELQGNETEGSLSDIAAKLAPELVLPVLEDRAMIPSVQSGDSSYTHFVTKDEGKLDFSSSWKTVHSIVRACSPWPHAYALLDGEKLLLTSVSGSVFDESEKPSEEPGTIVCLEKKKGLKIACTDGYIYCDRLLPPMKKEMDAQSFINGRKDVIGKILL